MGGAAKTWPLAQAWQVSVDVTAMAYGVDPALLTAPSRGRGPKPPLAVQEPKKVALFLTVVLSDSPYAHVGEHVGLHKDTLSSHCASVRELCAADPVTEARIEALQVAAQARLEARGAYPSRAADEASLFGLLMAAHAKLDRLAEQVAALHPPRSDGATLHPTAKPLRQPATAPVVEIATARRARR